MIVKERVATGVLKTCSKCKAEKDTSLFSTNRKMRDGIDSWCATCKAAGSKSYYWKNAKRERKKAKLRGRASETKRLARKAAEPQRFLCQWAKARAKKRGIVFALKPSDILVPDVCPVLGIPLAFGHGAGGAIDASPTLDRIIPNKGYVVGNVAVISRRANFLKNDATLEELNLLVRWLERQDAK